MLFLDQPAKGIYLIWLTTRILVSLPFVALYYVFSTRPRPEWTLFQSIVIWVLRKRGNLVGRARVATFTRDSSLAVDNSTLTKSSYVSIPALPDDMIVGVAQHNTIKPLASCAAYTYPRGADLSKQDTVGLYLHGGAFFAMTAHESFWAIPSNIFSKGLFAHTNCKAALAVDYRKSGHAPFPSALLDALSAYYHLTKTLGIDPSKILLLGDSAGGNLCLALCRYLVDTKCMPMPGKLLLLSPWTDMDTRFSQKPNASTDYLNDLIDFTSDIYVGRFDVRGNATKQTVDLLSPYASSCSPRVKATADLFKGFPPTVIHYGACERLVPDAEELHKRLQLAGVPSRLVCQKDGVHDPLILAFGGKQTQAQEWRKIAAGLQDI